MKKLVILIFMLSCQLSMGMKSWNKIPYPYKKMGISYIIANQLEKGKLKSASITMNPLNLDFFNPKSLEVKANLNLIKLDYFLLPFLNIYGIGGRIDTEASFNLGKGTLSFNPSGKPILDNIPFKKIKQKSEGNLYGAGALIAGEYKNIFTSFQYTYTEIKLKGDIATKSAEIGSGRLGYNYKYSNSINIMPYLSISYQKTDTSIKGKIPNTKLNYKFNMELEKETPSIGIFFKLPKNFTYLIDYSWGNKELLAMEIGYRF